MGVYKRLLNWKVLAGLFAAIGAIVIWLFLLTDTPRLTLFWLFGLAFGIIVQRSRFCFVSAISNFALFRDGRLLKGILGGLFVSTIGFAVIMFGEVPHPVSGIPSTAYIAPFGWHLVLAGTMFGLGMILAGGCFMGTFYRISEGMLTSLVALLGIIIGMGILQHNWPWWNIYISQLKAVWLPQYIGWFGSLVLTLGVVTILYWLVAHYGSKSVKTKRSAELLPLSARLNTVCKAIVIKSWPLALGGILLGGLNIWLFASAQRPCGLTGEVMRWTQIVLQALRLPAEPLATIPGS